MAVRCLLDCQGQVQVGEWQSFIFDEYTKREAVHTTHGDEWLRKFLATLKHGYEREAAEVGLATAHMERVEELEGKLTQAKARPYSIHCWRKSTTGLLRLRMRDVATRAYSPTPVRP